MLTKLYYGLVKTQGIDTYGPSVKGQINRYVLLQFCSQTFLLNGIICIYLYLSDQLLMSVWTSGTMLFSVLSENHPDTHLNNLTMNRSNEEIGGQ